MGHLKVKAAVLASTAGFLSALILAGCGDSQRAPARGRVSHNGGQELRGRDFVRLGEFTNVSGVLKPERGEWFLVSGGDIYEIHLGDHEHRARTGISLAEGKKAAVAGFLYEQEGASAKDVAVCTIAVDGREYRFREDDGTPLWRGRSSGAGQGSR